MAMFGDKSGLAMLLKSFGVDPEKILEQVDQIGANIKVVAESLTAIKAQNDEILSLLRKREPAAPAGENSMEGNNG